ncbi:MAG TPA: amidohydrolase family protein, partial [Planctomycetota bacterium]|nr:amidohydrolase family protein [Planctomycetota bacterium]
RGRRPAFPVPDLGPVAILAAAGLLRRGTLAVHANALRDAEITALARAGCVAVHCPGTHAFFRRGEPPVRRWIRAGLRFAIGTDSLASNDALDVFSEMAHLAASDPSIPAARIFEAATATGAAALGDRDAGTLLPGAPAELIGLAIDVPRSDADLLDALVRRPRIAAVVPAAVERKAEVPSPRRGS